MVKPFYFGMPTFEWSAILTMILVAMVSLVESTGVYFALGDICERKLKKKDLAKGYRAEGIAVLLGGIFNAFPYTTFSQNVGLNSNVRCEIKKSHCINAGNADYTWFCSENRCIDNNYSNRCFRRSDDRNVWNGYFPRN